MDGTLERASGTGQDSERRAPAAPPVARATPRPTSPADRLATATRPPIPLEFAVWLPIEGVRCCRGHHIPRRFMPMPAGGVQCRHDARGGTCDEWLYVIACNAAGMAYVLRVTKAQLDEVARLDLSPLATLAVLLAPATTPTR